MSHVNKTTIELTINGREHDGLAEPRQSLVEFLRMQGFKGTHVGCEHGSCGACTVLLDGEPVRSCLLFAVQVSGRNVETVDGLAKGDRLHPLQQSFATHGALQCGYCTPGFLMEGVALLRRRPSPTEVEIRDALSANVCRCTGYTPIEAAIRSCLSEGSDEEPY